MFDFYWYIPIVSEIMVFKKDLMSELVNPVKKMSLFPICRVSIFV